MEIRGGDKRHSIRLKEYDYSEPGFYFVTICVQDKKCILGKIIEEEDRCNGAKIILSNLGKIVERIWSAIPEHHKVAGLDEFVVMPNHIHGIIIIKNREINNSRGIACNAPTRNFIKQPAGSLATIVGSFKSEVSKLIHRLKGWENFFWQRNYYEHVVCNEKELEQIRNYIISNPTTWHDDPENPSKIKK